MVKKNNILVVIPTYNEYDNVVDIAHALLRLNLKLDILFIDDNSPDWTGLKLDRMKGKFGDTTISVIHRKGKLGVGSAHKVGINYAYIELYKVLITMDCDGTHDANDIITMLQCITDARGDYDIVVGSRHLAGDSLEGWSAWRKFVTHMGHILTTTLLGIPQDATGAFRMYRLDKIPQLTFSKVKSDDYSFFFESMVVFNINRFNIAEIPIILAARSAGHSKLHFKDLIKSMGYMLKLRYRMVFDKWSLIA